MPPRFGGMPEAHDPRSCSPRRYPGADARRASHRWHPRSSRSDESRSHPCSSGPPGPCSPNAPRATSRRHPTPPSRFLSSPTTAATPRHAPRPSPPTTPPTSTRRCRAGCDTTSSPTPPTRTTPAGHADARCPRTPRHHRRASTSPAPTPCPGHAPATVHPPPGSSPTNNHPAPTGPQTHQEHATRHEPRPGRRPLPPPPEACCYRPPRECPPGSRIRRLNNARIPYPEGISADAHTTTRHPT